MDGIRGKSDCLICGKPTVLKEAEIEGYKRPEKFSIHNCEHCDSSFSLPYKKDLSEIYNLIYKNIKQIPNYYRYWHYAENVLLHTNPLDYLSEQEEAYWAIKNSLVNKLKIGSGSSILEVGCGLGYLSYSLNKAGFNTTGIDISEEAISYAKSKYGDFYKCIDIGDLIQTDPKRYDIIILTEVIEHVYDIKSFMHLIKEALGVGGKIILTTPDKNLFNKYSSWHTELPPIHTWWLSKSSILQLGKELRMKVVFHGFRKFYDHSERLTILKLKNLIPEKSTFDESGMLINYNTGNYETHNIKKLPLKVKRLFGNYNYLFLKKLYYRCNRNYIVLGAKGFSLCAVLSNKHD